MRKILGFALMLLIPGMMPGATIIWVADGDPDDPTNSSVASSQAVAAGWTHAGSFSNVAITAPVAQFGSAVTTLRAYLTTSIGAGTTQGAHEIATTSFSTATQANPFPYITIFSGLSLGPGTYYLIMSWESGGSAASWNADTPTSVSSDVGATVAVGRLLAFSPFETYLPASNFTFISGAEPLYQVTGDSAIPEPSAMALVGLGLVGLAAIRRRR
ncbi:MAG: PEP-CTERM sorting domain-containing protein [Acidimicrobiia bacterium]|nr:PEP-CTERM sorting domain-containing protein [Acidimicrobiia bacterium]